MIFKKLCSKSKRFSQNSFGGIHLRKKKNREQTKKQKQVVDSLSV